MSRRGVIRGIHFTAVPPGQAKYVTCVAGAILDVVMDLRAGSLALGRWIAVTLDDSGGAVFIAEGLGHAWMALTETATMAYLCTQPYDPAAERAVHPLDPASASSGRSRSPCRRGTPPPPVSPRPQPWACCPPDADGDR